MLIPWSSRLFATFALSTIKSAAPSVKLDQGTFIGTTTGLTDHFLGIPFAKPPIGDLRLRMPVTLDPYNGTHNAVAFGPACTQQAFTVPYISGIAQEVVDALVNLIYSVITPSAEDCLTINVVAPAGVKPDAKLPVVVWFFGGGFAIGGTDTYDGGLIVKRSIELNEPVVYVSMNSRLSVFGYLASQEVIDAGVANLGMHDQRLALRWVQKYISAFGGDPTKVTLWGVSSGAVSAALHMITNGGNTEGLFRGAFLQSGSPLPVGNYTYGQVYYDQIVSETGCAGSSDTLQCLREVDFHKLKTAADHVPSIFSYQGLRFPWMPRTDGVFLTDDQQKLVQQGSVAKIPFVTGDCDDEATFFTISSLNITTESELRTYIKTNYYPDISTSDLDALLTTYPADITQGSPFNTSVRNAITPVYKQLAAIQGDVGFQAPRRFFLKHVAGKQPTWSYLNKRLKFLPIVGSAHATDLLNVYLGGDMMNFLINFVNHLDPNGKTSPVWPQYDVSAPKLMTFLDGLTPRTITSDDYRVEGMEVVTNISLKFPI